MPPRRPGHRAARDADRGDEVTASPEVEPASPRYTPSDQALWRYDSHSERGRVRRYSGHVTYLGGAAGERLRGEMAAAIHDLLVWAAAARNAAEDLPEQDKDKDDAA